MKKTKVLLISAIFLVVIFAVVMFLQFNNFKFYNIWFSLSLLFVGIYALIYFINFKLDSSLYYAVLLIALGSCSIVKYLYEFSFYFYYPIYIFCFAFASFAVFVRFRQNIHLKIFAILIFEGIILIGYKLNFFNIIPFYILNGLYLLLIGFDVLIRINKNLRSQKK